MARRKKSKAFGETDAFHRRAYEHGTRVLRKYLKEARGNLAGSTPFGPVQKCAWAFAAIVKASEAHGQLQADARSGDVGYRWRGGYKGSVGRYKTRGVGMKKALASTIKRFHAKCILTDR